MTVGAFGGIHAAAILSLAAFVGADEPQPSDDRVYEVIELTIGFTEAAYAAAPCEGCLDELGVLEAAGKYLYEVGVAYEALRTERWDHFAWCGLDAEEVVKTKMDRRFSSDATIYDYFRDDVFYNLRTISEKKRTTSEKITLARAPGRGGFGTGPAGWNANMRSGRWRSACFPWMRSLPMCRSSSRS